MKQQILQAALDRLRHAALDHKAAAAWEASASMGAQESEAYAATDRARKVLDREIGVTLIDDIYDIWRK